MNPRKPTAKDRKARFDRVMKGLGDKAPKGAHLIGFQEPTEGVEKVARGLGALARNCLLRNGRKAA